MAKYSIDIKELVTDNITKSMLPKRTIDITKLSQSIIANQIANNFNHELTGTKYYKQKLKASINLVQKELVKAEVIEYDALFDQKPEVTAEVYEIMEKMVKELCSVGLFHFGSITEIIKAFKKDPNSIQGIVNKINRT